jgi:hypothetical protein
MRLSRRRAASALFRRPGGAPRLVPELESRRALDRRALRCGSLVLVAQHHIEADPALQDKPEIRVTDHLVGQPVVLLSECWA